MPHIAIPVGISNRHVHISQHDLEILFGEGFQLHAKKPLSQPGQFASDEVVRVVGPKGALDKVRILGPVRPESQFECSQTDAYRLGIDLPVRDSGDLADTPGVTLVGPCGEVRLEHGAILACRHLHMTAEDARLMGLKDHDLVTVKTPGERSVVFHGVLVRVSDKYQLELHLDTDEANAALLHNGDLVSLVKDEPEQVPAPGLELLRMWLPMLDPRFNPFMRRSS